MTWRASADLIERVRRQAAEHGRSMNEWVTVVMEAATNPDFEQDDAARIRQRLRQAGLLEEAPGPARARPNRRAIAAARRTAGSGTALSEVVAQERR